MILKRPNQGTYFFNFIVNVIMQKIQYSLVPRRCNSVMMPVEKSRTFLFSCFICRFFRERKTSIFAEGSKNLCRQLSLNK